MLRTGSDTNAISNPNTHTETDANSDGPTYPNADSQANGDTDPKANANTDVEANCDSDKRAYGNTHPAANSVAQPDTHTCPKLQRAGIRVSDSDSSAKSEPYRRRDSDSHTAGNAIPDAE